MIHSMWSAQGMIRIRRTANERALLIKNDHALKSLCPDFVFRDIYLMTSINGFSFFVYLISFYQSIWGNSSSCCFLFIYINSFQRVFKSSIHFICQPTINITPTKTRVMTYLMLLHSCFKCLPGTTNFDLDSTFYKCTSRIYNSIYILNFQLA